MRLVKMAKIIKTCEYCGKEFSVYPSQSSRRFHSLECFRKHKAELEIDIMVEQLSEFKKLEVVSAVPISRATAERISQNLKDIPGLSYHLVATIE